MSLSRIALRALGLVLLALPAHALEEPGHTRVKVTDDYEIRQYAPYLVAEVTIRGTRDDADDQGFRLLFNYISGQNRGSKKISMTAPVTLAAKPEKIAMTAPVTRSETSEGYRVQFVLPAQFTLETAPEPTDARVQIRRIEGEQRAVRRFSGNWSTRNVNTELAALQAALARDGVATEGEPVFARYNAPFVPPFFRRNELWLRLRDR